MNLRLPSCVRAFFNWNCKLVALTACLWLGACLKSSGACIAAPSGVVAWFQGENDTIDMAGYLQPGQIVNGVGFSTAVKGQGFVFNGVNTYITNSRPMLTEITNSYTMEFWAWPSAARTSTTESTSGTADTSGQRYAIFPNAGSDVVGSGVSVGNNGVSVFENGNLYVPSLLVYNTSITAWTHVAVVYSNRQPSLYLNGVLVRVGLTSTRTSSPSTSLGAQNNGFNYGCYAGMLDEVTIYNRALSASEIQAIYLSGADGKCILPPTITAQPSDRTVVTGGTASLTVAISGSPPLLRQWLFNGVALAGQTNSSLRIASAQFSDAGSYSLMASNVAGVVTSSIATLTVAAPTSCIPAPNGLVAWFEAEGDTGDAASDLSPGTNVNGVGFAPGLKGQGFVFNGTNNFITNSTPKLLNISNTYTMEFWAWPNASRASTAETVSGAQGIGNQRYAIFPSYSGSPAVGAGVSVGTNGVSVFEHGDSYLPSLLVYDTPINGWTHIAVVYSNSQPSLYLNGTLVRAGLTSTRNSSPSTSLGEQGFNYGYYSGMLDEVSIYNRALPAPEIQAIYFSGANGKCSIPPSFVAQPAGSTAVLNSSAEMAALPKGSPPLAYQWLFNGVPVPGQTNTIMGIASVQFTNDGFYSLMASNPAGVATSSVARLTVVAATPCVPVPNGLLTWLQGEGDTTDATSDLPPGTIVNGVGFAPAMKGQGFVFNGTNSYITNATPMLSNVSNSYTMEFWAWPTASRASTAETTSGTPGTANQRYAIFPNAGPDNDVGSGVSVGTNGVSVFENGNLYVPSLLVYDTPIIGWTHIAVVYSNKQPSLYLNGTLVRTGLASTRNSSPSTSLGEQFNGLNYGYYSGMLDEVSIYNRALTASEIQSIYLSGMNGKCSMPPTFAVQPASQQVFQNTRADFSAAALGAPPLRYQWLFNGVLMPGQTKSTLTIASARGSDAGSYSMIASNPVGVATSSISSLTVIASSTCAPAPNGIVTWFAGEDTSDAASGLPPGTVVNGVGFAPAMKGQGFVFNGTNSYITNSTPMLSSISNSYTMEFWAWPTAPRASTTETTSGLVGVANQRYAIFPNAGPDNDVGSGVSVGNNGVSVFENANVYVPSLLVYDTPINGWTHVAVVYSNRQPSLYLNGTLVHTGLTSTRNSSPSTSLGEQSNGYNYGYYSGMLDEVSIYNRALTASEIQSIYLSGTNGKCSMRPTFVAQPASKQVFQNTRADFTAAAIGAPPLSYQWLFNGSPIPGQTNATFAIASAQGSDAGSYTMMASNPVGVATSSIASLTVMPSSPCAAAPNGIVTWFAGEGDTSDAASSLSPGTIINGVAFAPAMKGQGFVFNGTNSYITNTTPMLSNISNSYTMEFWAWPTAPRDSTAETTSGLIGIANQRYAIFPNAGPDNDVGSGVSVGTNGVSVFENANAYVPSLLVYDTPITRWTHIAVVYSNRQPSLYLNGTLVHTGLTSTRNSSPSTSLGEQFNGYNYGYYSGMLDEVSIYNRALTASEIQSIYLSGTNGKCSIPPTFMVQPASKQVFQNLRADFTASAVGAPPLSYQWLFNGAPIPGQTNSTFAIASAQGSDAGSYSMRASNPVGVATSSIASLTVMASSPCAPAPNGIVTWFQGEGDTVDIMSSVSAGTIVNGAGFAPGIKGQGFVFNGVNSYITNSTPKLLNISNSYTMEFWAWPNAGRANTAETVSGTAGTGNQRYAIFPAFDGSPAAGAGVSVGTNGVSVFEHANSYLPSLLAYDVPITNWTHIAVVYSNRQPSLYLNGALVRTGLTSTRDSSPSTELGEQGFGYGYYSGMLDEVSIYNRALTASEIQSIYSAAANGKCRLPPSFLVQPTQTTAVLNSSARMAAVAAASPPLAYQWLFNGLPVPGQTNTALRIASVQFTNDGFYSLMASNSVAVATSSVARLIVLAPSPCVPAPAGLVAWLGGGNDTQDSVGTLSPGTNVNGVGFAPAMKGQGFVFNGTNSYITNATPMLSNISNSYTMEFWAWPTAPRDSTPETTSGLVGAANQRYAIFPNAGPDNDVGSGVSVGTNGVSVFENANLYVPSLLVYDTPINGWTHIAVVYSNRQPSLYLNGTFVHTGLTSTRNSSPSTSLGEQFNGYNYGYYSGMLDEVSIYNRALTASEIQSIYLSGANGKCSLPPTFIEQPSNRAVLVGDPVDIPTIVSGDSPMTLQWQFNGVPLPASTGFTLHIGAAQLSDSGSYTLVASNVVGAVTSTVATVTVTAPTTCAFPPAGIVSWWEGENDTWDTIGSLTPGVIVNAVGFAPAVKGHGFVFNGTNAYITNAIRMLSSVTNSYTMEFWAWPNAARTSTAESTSGTAGASNQRYAIFPNNGGSGVLGAGISVGSNGISVFEHGSSYLPSLLVYDTAITNWTHLAVVYSNQQPSLYLNGRLVRTGLTSTHVSSPSTCLGEQGYGYGYYSGMLDEVSMYNRALAPAEIQALYLTGNQGKCSVPPTFVLNPLDQTSAAGNSASISGKAMGSSPLTYQWLLNDVPLAGETNATLAIPVVQFADAGSYVLQASNFLGVATSSPAVLSVVSCIPPPAGVVTWLEGENDLRDAEGTLAPGTNMFGVGFAPAVRGQGFVFNGANFITNSTPVLTTISNSFTMEFWAWPNAAQTNTTESTSGVSGTANQRYAIFPNYGGSGNPGVGVSVGTNGVSVFEHAPAYLPSLLVYPTLITNWTHIAVVYSNRQPSLYLNGVLVRVGLTSSRTSNPSTCLGEQGYGYGYYSGMLDEVGIYARPLAASEIQTLYAAGAHGRCSLAPAFTAQPVDRHVLMGKPCSFSAMAKGSSPLTYQWLFNGTPLAGKTGTTLTLASAQVSDSGSYSLMASNMSGLATSSIAALIVSTPAPCVPAPNGLMAWLEGENDTTDADGDLLPGTNINGVAFAPGVKGQAFAFNGTSSYITNSKPTLPSVTNTYTMEFWAWPTASRTTATESTSSSSGRSGQRYAIFPFNNGGGIRGAGVSVGTNGVSVVENGFTFPGLPIVTPVLVYDTPITNWTHVAVVYNNKQPSLYLDGVLVHVGLTSSSASTPSTSLGEQGLGYGYYAGLLDEVSIYNRALAASEIQAIYFASTNGKCSLPPTITFQPADMTVLAGTAAQFAGLAYGSSPLAYQWLFNGNPLAGQNSPRLTIGSAIPSDTGSYSMVASNAVGMATSSIANLTVLGPSACVAAPGGIAAWFEGQNDARDALGNLVAGVLVNGIGFAPGVKGQGFVFNGTNSYITNATRVLSSITNTYTIEFWTWPTAGRTSTAESTSGTAGTLNQRYAIFPNNGGSGVVGSGISIGTNGVSVFESGSSYLPSLLVYDALITNWTHVAVVYSNQQPSLYLNGTLVRVGRTSGRSSSPSTCLGEQGFGYGYYAGMLDEVSIYNRALAPSEVQAAYLAGNNGKCSTPPVFTVQPGDQTVLLGTAVYVSALAGGSSPMTFQWLFNANPLAGQTNQTLNIWPAQLSDTGGYSLVASNVSGVATSVIATLTVVAPTPCVAPANGLVTWLEAENDTRDTTAGLLPGTIINGVGFGLGFKGEAFVFNGTNGCITNATRMLSSITNNYTMEFWALPTAARASVTEATSGTAGASNQRYAIFPNNGSNGVVGAGISVGTNGVAVFEHGSAYLPSLLVYDTAITNWAHVAVVYSNQQPRLYLNGTLVRTGLASTHASSPSTCLGEQGYGYGYYSGALDEVSIYNRSLSASEIQAIYSAGYNGKCSLPPSFVTQPADATVLAGHPAYFYATPGGSFPLACQWLFNGNSLPGQTNILLAIGSPQAQDAGSYSLTISNSAGVATSSVATLTVLSSPCQPPPAGIIMWLEGQNDLSDAAGSLSPGTIVNGAGFAPGAKGQGFVFNGTNSFITNALEMFSAITNTYTMEFWALPNAARASTTESTSGTGGTLNQRYAIFPNNGGGAVVGSGVSVGTNGVSVCEHGNGYLPTLLVYDTPMTNWTHVAVVYSNQQPNLYLNGTFVRAGLASTRSSCPSISLGEQGYGYGYYSGMLDEVSIYNRALTLPEIQAIYMAGPNGKCSTPPVFLSSPQDQKVLEGTWVNLSGSVSGSSPLALQWMFNGLPLPAKTNRLLSIASARLSDTGAYSLVASNLSGVATSAIATLTVVSPTPCVPAASGLVTWLEAENDTRDVTMGLSPGTIVNGVAFSAAVEGQGFVFNGVNSYITNSTSKLTTISNTYTMEFWAWPAASRASTAETVSGAQGTANQRYAVFPSYSSTGLVGAGLSVGTNGVSVFEHGNSYLPSLLVYDTPITNWTHIAVTYSNRQPSLYLNGVLVRLGLTSTSNSCPSTSLGEQGFSYGYYSGMLDEFSIYNRALSPAEIQAIYWAYSNGKCRQPPTFVTQPVGQTIFGNQTASFYPIVSGSSPLAFQWLFNGNVLPGQTNNILMFASPQAADSGTYSLTASNSAGLTTSSTARLTVLASPCVPDPTGLAMWMQGENDTTDTTGNLLPGANAGVGFAPAVKGRGFVFGTSGFITNTVRMLTAITNTYTMEFWARPNAARADTSEATSGIAGTSNQRYAIFPNNGSNGLVVGSGVSVGTNGVSVFEHGNNYLPALLVYDTLITNWTHVAVVYSNQQPRLYLNGTLVRTGLASTQVSSPSTCLGEQGYGYGYYSGMLDEVSIYNRALSLAEIQAIYLAGNNGKCGLLATITQQPIPVTTNAGTSVRFNVSASSASPMYYRWFKNSTSVGSNAAQLLISNVTRLDGGLYSVQISNDAGTVMSSNALLKILVPQKFGVPVIFADGTIGFVSQDADGGLLTSNDVNAFTAQVSSNLSTWTILSNALSLTNGMLLIKDPYQTNFSSRFYRLYEK